MIKFGRNGPFYVLIDDSKGIQMELDRGAAKAVSRFLISELNIIDAILIDSRSLLESDEIFVKMIETKFDKLEVENARQKYAARRQGQKTEG